MTSAGFLYSKGIVFSPADTPPISTFLESNPGAYTTTRTHNNSASLLFWDRHLQRLSNSVKILLTSNPQFLFKSLNSTINPLLTPPPPSDPVWESTIKSLVNESVNKVLPVALRETRNEGEELAVTALVTGNTEKLGEVKRNVFEALDVHVHVGSHVPHVFGVKGYGARVAVVGPGRNIAEAKYSDWVRLRKSLEKLRPPLVTELLLSNDGDRILEGCVTNFFVVCRKDNRNEKYLGGNENTLPYEVQTAPIGDGVLPGVIRQLVIE
ncbi:D-AMINOACID AMINOTRANSFERASE-LIKE PLP-DEPENDENT ENZYMES SUPERFAMILY PROTEIN [Salix purpurea]|nr:D-AMINOACID AMINOTRANSFERASE-LIKE PLP-DEPENDENT ENZYMES SUPERFAMILY PROTEIN [Salix purpurea]KAJ6717749.1 D-AMINOACID AMINOTRANSFERASE-LIKE PLP-DEPENDENT ENZYMES SUPERFAMILY PROTEIN [Salix purpurea]